jgi:peptidoglycan lytic transglycosylase
MADRDRLRQWRNGAPLRPVPAHRSSDSSPEGRAANRRPAATVRVMALLMIALFVGWTTPAQPTAAVPDRSRGQVQVGEASWYGKFHNGRQTASGEIFAMNRLTAAHPDLPLGTWILVTNLNNGLMVRVRVNDRGPFVDGRILDLSYAAARRLRALSDGAIPVEVRVLSVPNGLTAHRSTPSRGES